MLKEKVLNVLKEGGTVLLLGTGTDYVAKDLVKSLPKPDDSESIQISDDIRIHPKGVRIYPISYLSDYYDMVAVAGAPCVIYNDTTPEYMKLSKMRYNEWLTAFLRKLQDDYTLLIVHCKDAKILGLFRRLDESEVHNG